MIRCPDDMQSLGSDLAYVYKRRQLARDFLLRCQLYEIETLNLRDGDAIGHQTDRISDGDLIKVKPGWILSRSSRDGSMSDPASDPTLSAASSTAASTSSSPPLALAHRDTA